MPALILTPENVSKTLYSMNRNYQGQQSWREAFYNTELAEQQTLSGLQYDYNQALGEAYLSSLQNAQAISSSSLGQGYKEQAMQANLNDLHSAYDEYRKVYLENAVKTQQQYSSVEQNLQNTLNQASQNVIKYQDAYFDYLKYLQGMADEGKLDISGDDWSKYTVTENEMRRLKTKEELLFPGELYDTEGNITEQGLDFYNFVEQLGAKGVYSWFNYLYNYKKDIYDWATAPSYDARYTNYDMYRNIR